MATVKTASGVPMQPANMPPAPLDGLHGSLQSNALHNSLQNLPPGHAAAHSDDILTRQEAEAEATTTVVLFYCLLLVMISAQASLFLWRKRHKKSYELVTLFGLWIVPAVICVQFKFWRFLLVWVCYSLVVISLLLECTKKKLAATTPRKVYSFFLIMHRVCTAVGVSGYLLLLLDVFGVSELLRIPQSTSIMLLWYGLYFGILGRDCAEVAADQMASVMSYGRSMVSTVSNCGICSNELKDFTHIGEQPAAEAVVQLECKHCFHSLCIRGWTLVGKKDTCPVCLEKVDLKHLFGDRPWETRNLTWIQMLDALRYMVVWNPIIILAFGVVSHMLGVDKHHHTHVPPPPPLSPGMGSIPVLTHH